jgi:hypothetical protein
MQNPPGSDCHDGFQLKLYGRRSLYSILLSPMFLPDNFSCQSLIRLPYGSCNCWPSDSVIEISSGCDPTAAEVAR